MNAPRSGGPINLTLEALVDRWSLIVIRDLMFGNRRTIRFGAYNKCPTCGLLPRTEIDVAYSLALTDHYFSRDVLNQISADMKQGVPRPSLPPEQDDTDEWMRQLQERVERTWWFVRR